MGTELDINAVDIPNSFAILGKAGKYISIDKGPSEVSNANNKIHAVEYCCMLGCGADGGVLFELGKVFDMLIFYREMTDVQTSLHAS